MGIETLLEARHRLARLIFTCLLVLSPACYSLSLMQEPKPLRPGTVRVIAGNGFNTARGAPDLNLGLRVGLFPRTEARVKLTLFNESAAVQSVQAGFNFELYAGRYQSVVVMPYYRYDPAVWEDQDELFDETAYPHHRVHAFAMPLLFVQHIGRSHLFIGPDLHVGARDGDSFVALGGHVGVSIAAGKYAHITPEFSLLTVVSGVEPALNRAFDVRETALTLHDVIGEIGLSCTFGAEN